MMRNPRTFVRILLWGLSILLVLGYVAFEARGFIIGPTLSVTHPQNGSATSTDLITIQGTTARVQDITLNDRAIFIDEEGTFEEQLLLLPRYNIITLRVEDRFGREKETFLEIVHTESPQATMTEQSTTTATTTLDTIN